MFFTTIINFILNNKLVQYALIGLAIFLALWGVYSHIYNKGVAKGQEQATIEYKKDVELATKFWINKNKKQAEQEELAKSKILEENEKIKKERVVIKQSLAAEREKNKVRSQELDKVCFSTPERIELLNRKTKNNF